MGELTVDSPFVADWRSMLGLALVVVVGMACSRWVLCLPDASMRPPCMGCCMHTQCAARSSMHTVSSTQHHHPLYGELPKGTSCAPTNWVLFWHPALLQVGCLANTAGVGGGAIFIPIFQVRLACLRACACIMRVCLCPLGLHFA
jgi:uncharacterized membrane protein YfcA